MTVCVVCRRRPPARGQVCDGDRDNIAKLLADLPRKMAALERQLVPSPTGAGERVSTSRTGSPMPARLDALSLSGPGAGRVTPMLHPKVRRWSTSRTVTVQIPGQEPVDRTVTDWHQELLVDDDGQPVLVADDDQIGTLPPAEWLAWTVRAWQEHFGHHLGRGRAAPPPRRRRELDAVERHQAAVKHLGLGSARRAGDRDPLGEEWEIRFGEPARAEQPAADVAYLLNWMDVACDDADTLDLAAMSTELRSLSAELARVLGEQPDQAWLGRCPAQVTDRFEPADPGAEDAPLRRPVNRPCGAGLWHEPFASGVQCPRCHSVWPQPQLLALAYAIREVWPIDRRRRYHLAEIRALRAPRCPGCGKTTGIEWRNATGTDDDTMWWRPVKVTCPASCPDTERLL